jgi:hypothetical protein
MFRLLASDAGLLVRLLGLIGCFEWHGMARNSLFGI